MRKNVFIALAALACTLYFTSCQTRYMSSWGEGTTLNPKVKASSVNEYDLVISEDYITYTIDISTSEGALLLKNKTLAQAQETVENEAAMKHHCDLIWQPKYSKLVEGKNILRITISGRPANYKSSKNKN